ncbi:hypothetical protein BHM03_00059875, partial [Ensete ventricosum]
AAPFSNTRAPFHNLSRCLCVFVCRRYNFDRESRVSGSERRDTVDEEVVLEGIIGGDWRGNLWVRAEVNRWWEMWWEGGRFYWGSKEGREGIVVVFAWLSSQERHLKPYVQLYSTFGWRSLICHADFLTLFFPEKASSLADGVLKELLQNHYWAYPHQRLQKALGHSPKCSGEARRGPSASLNVQAARFKEVSPGRSPEPRRQVLRASNRVKPGDRTRFLAPVRSHLR